MHARILNKEHVRIIDSKTAMAEINHAMMGGKNDVIEMNHSGQSASIIYADGRHVTLRPATETEIRDAEKRVWNSTKSNGTLHHRFDGDLKAVCNKRITSHGASRITVKNSTGKWVGADLIGHANLMTQTQVEAKEYTTLCPKCLG